jgi:hypothetical protein
MVLLSIMKTDRLFFEFMHEVFKEKFILGDFILKDIDINNFFDIKKTQSETVSKWTDIIITKLKRCYARMLLEVATMHGIKDLRVKEQEKTKDYWIKSKISTIKVVRFLGLLRLSKL